MSLQKDENGNLILCKSKEIVTLVSEFDFPRPRCQSPYQITVLGHTLSHWEGRGTMLVASSSLGDFERGRSAVAINC